MNALKICLLGFSLLVFANCTNTSKAVSNNAVVQNEDAKAKKKKVKIPKAPKESRYANMLSLVDVFRTISGVRVLGNGNHPDLQVMGITTSGTPLFVINGAPSNASFGELNGTIAPSNIKRVRVLRTPSELGLYGVRGAAGVIEITLK